jgi:hypothetical protein
MRSPSVDGGQDRTPIRFASLVADEIGGFQRPPGYDLD